MHLIEAMPAKTYHADPAPKLIPGCKASLSRSIAVTLLQRSPLHAWTEHPKLNPKYEPEDSTKFDLGTVAHKALLEMQSSDDPEKAGICVLHFDDYRKKEAQEARNYAIEDSLLPVLGRQWEDVQEMVKSARLFLQRSELAGIFTGAKTEVTLIWQQANAWLRARPDLISADEMVMLDYKTTESAEPNAWSRWVMGATGADIQAAFYLSGYMLTRKKSPRFVNLLQETKPPYACSLVGLSPADLALAQDKVLAAVELWEQCLRTNSWPSYSGRVHWIERPAFVEADWAQRKEYLYDTLFGGNHGV